MSKIKKNEQFEAQKKQNYTITNWSAYNKSLENRGDITFMISDNVIATWYSDSEEPQQRGGQEKYSDTCIETIMMSKTVFRLAYRQARGFTLGILKLMNLGKRPSNCILPCWRPGPIFAIKRNKR